MKLLLYLTLLIAGLCLGRYFKRAFTGPDLGFPGVFFCFLFNGFFIALHLDIVTYGDIFFVGDVSSSVDEYPLVLWLAIVAAVVQATFIPKKD
ncbi:hypothetical protein [Pseudomonas sp. H9]|uniref:hypothetical protein n=1 Tax=Pseudomonas sp. H9 TaxID=483968 RepID=UPI0010577200|nr:hypothetical protein [Pseudomonas sp. H9]TDF85026.1 hypothetical protein E1573_05130 [Pseudomonas sp. H9]